METSTATEPGGCLSWSGQSMEVVRSADRLDWSPFYCKWFTNPEGRTGQEPQMVAAWKLVLGDHAHWQHLAEWSTVLWIALDGIWQWKGITLSLIKWLGEVQAWCRKTADALERQQMRQRKGRAEGEAGRQVPWVWMGCCSTSASGRGHGSRRRAQ